MASFCVFCSALLSPSPLRLFQPVCLRRGPWHWRYTAKKYVGQRLERGVGAKELPFLACFACLLLFCLVRTRRRCSFYDRKDTLSGKGLRQLCRRPGQR